MRYRDPIICAPVQVGTVAAPPKPHPLFTYHPSLFCFFLFHVDCTNCDGKNKCDDCNDTGYSYRGPGQ